MMLSFMNLTIFLSDLQAFLRFHAFPGSNVIHRDSIVMLRPLLLRFCLNLPDLGGCWLECYKDHLLGASGLRRASRYLFMVRLVANISCLFILFTLSLVHGLEIFHIVFTPFLHFLHTRRAGSVGFTLQWVFYLGQPPRDIRSSPVWNMAGEWSRVVQTSTF